MRSKLPLILLALLSLFFLALWGGRVALLFVLFLAVLAGIAYFLTLRRPDTVQVSRLVTPTRLSIGEQAEVVLTVENRSKLPLPWLELWEFLPPYIVCKTGVTRYAMSLLAGEKRTFQYTITPHRRGEFALNPLLLTTGDPWGLWRRERRVDAPTALVVFPKIVPLERLRLPLRKPFEGRKSGIRAYEDYTAISGVRAYTPQDPLKRIHWKLSAHTGNLLVKEFEFSVNTVITVWVDLVSGGHETPFQEVYEDFAMMTAASLLHFASQKHIPSSLAIFPEVAQPEELGLDPIHFLRQMEILARAKSENGDLVECVRQSARRLPWQSNLILVSSFLSAEILTRLVELRLRTQHLTLYLIYEGSFRLPWEKPRRSFMLDPLEVADLRHKKAMLEDQHVHVHLIGENDSLLGVM